jgi:hypothetical protein
MVERFRLREQGLDWRTVEDEVVAIDLVAETYLGVNRTGRALWEALVKGATKEDLVQSLVDRYGIGYDDADRDVGQFIGALQKFGVIESRPE